MAGSKKDAFENNLLKHIFQNAALPLIGDAAGLLPSAVAGSLYLALYTVNPSESAAGTETAYTNYVRVAIARSAAGFTVTNNTVTNAALVTSATCGATGATLTGFAICTGSTLNANDAIYWGELTNSLIVSNGIAPEFAIGALTVTED